MMQRHLVFLDTLSKLNEDVKIQYSSLNEHEQTPSLIAEVLISSKILDASSIVDMRGDVNQDTQTPEYHPTGLYPLQVLIKTLSFLYWMGTCLKIWGPDRIKPVIKDKISSLKHKTRNQLDAELERNKTRNFILASWLFHKLRIHILWMRNDLVRPLCLI